MLEQRRVHSAYSAVADRETRGRGDEVDFGEAAAALSLQANTNFELELQRNESMKLYISRYIR